MLHEADNTINIGLIPSQCEMTIPGQCEVTILGRNLVVDEQKLKEILGFSEDALDALDSNTEYFEQVPPEPQQVAEPGQVIFAGLGIAVLVAGTRLYVQLAREKKQVQLNQLYLEKKELEKRMAHMQKLNILGYNDHRIEELGKRQSELDKQQRELTRGIFGAKPPVEKVGDKGSACRIIPEDEVPGRIRSLTPRTNMWSDSMDLGLGDVDIPRDTLELFCFQILIRRLNTLREMSELDAVPAMSS